MIATDLRVRNYIKKAAVHKVKPTPELRIYNLGKIEAIKKMQVPKQNFVAGAYRENISVDKN